MVANDLVPLTERAGPSGFGRTEDCHRRHAEESGEVHGAGVVGDQDGAPRQFVHQFVEIGFANAVVGEVTEFAR